MDMLFFLIIGAAVGTVDDVLPERLLVDAQAAVVEIDAVANDRQLIRLPSLQFALAIKPLCGATGRVESISVSAADTRRNYGVDDIDEQSVIDAALSIPSQQLWLVRIGDFCRTPIANTAEDTELTIQGALTAHLSLRCVNDEEQSITYVSQALDIVLRCNNVDDGSIESPRDQESSAESDPKL
jgi:hypothetical protein